MILLLEDFLFFARTRKRENEKREREKEKKTFSDFTIHNPQGSRIFQQRKKNQTNIH